MTTDPTGTVEATVATLAALMIVPMYVVYFRKIRAGRTQPHPVSWALWAAESYTAGLIQTVSGARWGALPTFIVGAACTWIAVVAWRAGYLRHASRGDYVCGACTVIAWGVWLGAGNEGVAAAAVSTAYVLAFAPTAAKAWNKPYSEPPATYVFGGARSALALCVVGTYSVASSLYLVVGGAAEFAFVALILVRRAQCPAPALTH